MWSIRSRITFLVLLGTVTEAVLLGSVGYLSIDAVSRNAKDLQHISLALDGTRELSDAVSRLAHPYYAAEDSLGWDSQLFLDDIRAMEQRLDTCAASQCHGTAKHPPAMARQMKAWLGEIREGGLALFADRSESEPFPSDLWLGVLEQPAHAMSEASDAMARKLTTRIRTLDRSTEDARRAGTLFVVLATILSVIVVVTISHTVSRGITGPLRALTRRLSTLGPDEEQARVSETGPEEVVRLARSFNLMTDHLAESRAALRAHQAELEQRVQEGIAGLRQKDEELHRSDRMATVGMVASSMAHDLHNPLSAVLVNAELLAEDLQPSDDNNALVKDLVTDVRRCCTVATEIRAMAREREVRMQPCDVGDFVDTAAEAVRMLRFKWMPLGITVTINSSDDDTSRSCLCSLPRIHQVLVNLIDNALAVSPPGGKVAVRVHGSATSIRIEVEDQGPGIPRAHREHLLKPFTTTKAGGLGLGLALCRRIVEQHRARIEFDTCTRDDLEHVPGETVPGRDRPGTVVRITLPRTEPGEEAEP